MRRSQGQPPQALFSVSEALYVWMRNARITSAVADAMGVSSSKLSAELRPSNAQAKLSADDLIPLFAAIRRVGYGRELEGILYEFVAGLEGVEPSEGTDEEMLPRVVILAKSLKMLFDCADRSSTMADQAELVRLYRMIQTELLPAVMELGRTVQSRLKTVRANSAGLPSSLSIPQSQLGGIP